MQNISVKTSAHTDFIDITNDVQQQIPAGFDGVCLVFCRHTTAGLTINENADPDVVRDLKNELDRLVPGDNSRFQHMEGNSAAHMKSSMLGVSLTVPVTDGKLALGTWQSLYFCEFDGPRSRQVTVRLLA